MSTLPQAVSAVSPLGAAIDGTRSPVRRQRRAGGPASGPVEYTRVEPRVWRDVKRVLARYASDEIPVRVDIIHAQRVEITEVRHG